MKVLLELEEGEYKMLLEYLEEVKRHYLELFKISGNQIFFDAVSCVNEILTAVKKGGNKP